ncbi:hypothetical protein Pint_14751 [Pistacia integerrima]|uniref:Uncharacterized protein n=1 Tax=Pistacia integerrima TaxID=434235 RepID=A0ACC0Y6N3_9ROSI|nr:hypothetical protein Pint_14751 [Pistacia integerrima]
MNYFTIGTSWINFDDVEAIRAKVSYAKKKGTLATSRGKSYLMITGYFQAAIILLTVIRRPSSQSHRRGVAISELLSLTDHVIGSSSPVSYIVASSSPLSLRHKTHDYPLSLLHIIVIPSLSPSASLLSHHHRSHRSVS